VQTQQLHFVCSNSHVTVLMLSSFNSYRPFQQWFSTVVDYYLVLVLVLVFFGRIEVQLILHAYIIFYKLHILSRICKLGKCCCVNCLTDCLVTPSTDSEQKN